ncbi:MAG: TraX family protein [Roseburia sp.]
MKGLNRTQLKLIAIAAMVCDHVAWGFLDFMTPLAQVMHIIGRLTIPTMCFFVAEGFRHTSSKKGYLGRMTLFWVVSALPFYLFFHETYEYRQNIIFDLMLGLMMLMVLENKKFRLWQKVMLGLMIFLISIFVGGWIIVPILFILAFYYGRNFKEKAVWICRITVALVLFLVVATSLNQIWHFSHYDWVWYGELYLLGFMLPLVLLKQYNGQKGKNIGKYFFYIFYPAHFLVLAGAKALLAGCTIYQIYVGLHVAALLVCMGILLLVLLAKPSRGQSATLLLVLSGCVYIFGFIVEIVSSDVNGFYVATLVQYFGECVLMISFTMFVAEMCHREIPAFIYALEGLCGILVMWMLFTTRENRIFYLSMGVDRNGPFPRFALERGWGFWVFVAYVAVVCIGCLVICILGIMRSRGAERKRILCTAGAVFCPWIPNFIRGLGVTGGYEIPGLGVVGAIILVGLALIRFGYFDSIALAGENALNHGKEGIMVINTNHVITYYNERMEEMFGGLSRKKDAYKNGTLADIFEGRIKTLELAGRMYEMRVETLTEGGYEQGRMLWVLDITEHHNILMKVNELARKDSLTGVYNRNCFKGILEDYLKQQGKGALFMMDMEHFKRVNDRFGHQAGDEALAKFGQILLELGEEAISCRIGGDEFCLFYKDVLDVRELEKLAEKIKDDFREKISGEKYAGLTTVSVGIARTLDVAGRDFEKLYSSADKALYVAKNRSENGCYVI